MIEDDPDVPVTVFLARHHLKKYGILTLGIALLFLSLIVHQMYASRRLAWEGARTNGQNLALVLESNLIGQMDAIEQAVAAVAAEIPPDAMEPAAADRFWTDVTTRLRLRLQELPSATALALFAADGGRLYSTRPGEPRASVADQPFFQTLRANPLVTTGFSSVVADGAFGTRAMLVARPVRDLHGTFLGAVVLSLDLSALNDYFGRLSLGSKGVVGLMRLEDGERLAKVPASPSGPAGSHDIPDDMIREMIRSSGPSGMVETPGPGPSRLIAFRTIGIYPFYVAVGLAEDDYLAAWRQNTLWSVGASILFLVVLVAVFYRLALAEMRRDRSLALLAASRRLLEEAQRTAELAPFTYDIADDRWDSAEILDGLLGIDRDHPRDGAHWLALVAPDMRPEVARRWEATLREGAPFDMEYRVIRPADGAERWLHGIRKLRRDRAGRPMTVVGTEQDVTRRKQSELALADQRNLLQSIIDTVPAQVFWKDRSLRFLGCNPAFARHAGKAGPAGVIGCDDFQMGWRDQAERYRADDREVMELGRSKLSYEEPQTTPDGRAIWLRTSKVPLRDRTGDIIGVLGIFEDITDQKRRDAELRLAASVFANSYEGIIITDARNVIVDVNPALTRITGYERDEIIGQTPAILASGRQGTDFYARMWTSLRERDFWQGEIWNRRKNGEVYAEVLAISVVRDTDGALQHYIAIFSDISQLKSHEAELDRIAHYDSLTGVPNRRLLIDRLNQAIAHARRTGVPLAVCYLDLDGFKPVNDRHGHAAGDQLLVAATDRLKGVLRASDTLARLGGDEFVILFTDFTQITEIQIVLNRVLTALNTPFPIEAGDVGISASIGVTLFPSDDADADTLLRHADQAMYRAKEAGKNRYHLFDPDQDRLVRAHRYHMRRLRQALESGEFTLYYQPKVDLVSGEVIGAEALIRWRHPERGLLLPSDFMQFLVGSELDIPVGQWVLATVLKQIALWDAIGLSLTVSANISARHLLDPDFTSDLKRLLDEQPYVLPGSLEIEILETVALADTQRASDVLARCRAFGVVCALDDFGTGFSSLTYFRSLPVQMLKIDQGFVQGMLQSPDNLGIVESIVRLAQAFDRPVIAEGVETMDHAAMLVRLGCRLAQGDAIGRPMTAEQVPAWVLEWRRKALWRQLPGAVITSAG